MFLDRFRLDDRVAIVTGAGQGIGAGIALAFAEAGADVVCGARTQAKIDAVADQVRARGRRGLAVACHVMKRDDLEGLVRRALDEFGRIDVLVNNAGGSAPAPALRTSERYMESVLRFNLVSPFLLSRLVAPQIVATAGGGSIVNISSGAGLLGLSGFAAYGSAKPDWGFANLRYSIAVEGEPNLRLELDPTLAASDDAPWGASPEQAGLVCTAMNGVNAIPALCAAPPGLRTLLDLGLPRAGRLGAARGRRS